MMEPISKMIALPLESRRTFSGFKSELIIEAVPYFEIELLDIMLNEELIALQAEKDSSEI